MKKQKIKISYLFVGICIGVFATWSILWWQGDNSLNKFDFFKKTKVYFSNFFNKKSSEKIIINQPAPVINKSNKINKLTDQNLKNDSAYFDSTSINLYDPNALDEFLAIYNGKLPDSLLLDSIIKSQNNIDVNTYSTTNNISVKKDKLINAKSYNVNGIDNYFNISSAKIDSLLTDNQTETNDLSNNLRVEFWKSPINYKGYKIGMNKLVVFGLDKVEMISFKIFNKTLYMKYITEYYQIDNTSDFKSLNPINNKQIISQFENK